MHNFIIILVGFFQVKVDENEIVIVTVPEYLNKFQKLMQETDKRYVPYACIPVILQFLLIKLVELMNKEN